jgi:heptosyltransferase-3
MHTDTLIIRPGALGDTLMALPALVDLSSTTTVTFVGRQPGLFFLRDQVSVAFDLEGSGWYRLFTVEPDGRGLPVSHADRVVAFLADADGRIARNLRAYYPQASVHLFSSFPPADKPIHVARYLCDCLALAGLSVNANRSLERALNGSLLHGDKTLRRKDRIVFHPGSGDKRKNHPPAFWQALMTRVLRETGRRSPKPLMILGPAEEALVPSTGEDPIRREWDVVVCPDKGHLREILAGASLFLGQDSGVTHLAALLGAPTVALFKASDPVQWRPLGSTVELVVSVDVDSALIEHVLEAAKRILPA